MASSTKGEHVAKRESRHSFYLVLDQEGNQERMNVSVHIQHGMAVSIIGRPGAKQLFHDQSHRSGFRCTFRKGRNQFSQSRTSVLISLRATTVAECCGG